MTYTEKILAEFDFEYHEVDYLHSTFGIGYDLQNRLEEGYEIWRDNKNMSWRAKRNKLVTKLYKHKPLTK